MSNEPNVVEKRELLKCGKCGMAIIRVNDQIVRACTCQASIIAELKATVTGNGGIC